MGPESESSFERSLTSTGYGKFHLMLFVLLGLTYSALAMEVTMVSFVIPSARSDFSLTSSDAGLLTALPMLGMTVGSFVWGCLADLGGRRKVMVSSLLMGGLTGLASSFAQFFWLFLLLRFFNGFAIAGALSICLPYLGEFHPQASRERILSWMELFWTIGIIGVPCLAWGIIPLKMRYESTYFVFDSWNLFVGASALPLLILSGWASTFPESPKFLLERGQYKKALEVLKHMYSKNTGNDPSLFEIHNMEEKGISFIELESNKKQAKKATLGNTVKKITFITRTLFKPPHRRSTILTCLISYGVTASYYTLMMWFPELFTRFEQYDKLNPNRTSSVCEVSSVFVLDPQAVPTGPIQTEVFVNTAIVGLACIPTSLWYPFCLQKVGAKYFMMICLTIAGCVTMGMYLVRSSLENLILSCVFEAFTSLGVVTFFCVMVDLYPTNVRVMATGLSICFGRLGALTGNLLFGFLIDLNCVVPIVGFTLVLFATAALCFFLPIKRVRKILI